MPAENSFAALGIKQEWMEVLQQMNIVNPTPIQQAAIPHIQQGDDVIAESQTGSGKTLAYLLPVLLHIDPAVKQLQAMVIVPTRELAMQILHEIEKFREVSEITGQALIGGAALNRQVDRLKQHPQIVVGTPGRILELLQMRKLKMNQVRTIVIDEVDQVLALGSVRDVENILQKTQRDRQILVFSATIPPMVHEMAERWMQQSVHLSFRSAGRSPEQIEHYYFLCEPRDKIDMLRRLIHLFAPASALIFVNDTDDIGELAAKLQYMGLSVEALYGDSRKQERAAVMNRFRTQRTQLLLATDVAARGLDIEGLTYVFHFDPPVDADHYVHRSGRTGRMGNKGWAISIITPKQRFIMEKFAQKLGITISEKAMYEGKLIDPGSRSKQSLPQKTVSRELTRKGDRSASAAMSKTATNQANKKMKKRDRKNKGAPRWLKEKQNKQ